MGLDSQNILEVKNIEVVYDNVILALHNVSLIVPRGKIVALLGANGAWKNGACRMESGTELDASVVLGLPPILC